MTHDTTAPSWTGRALALRGAGWVLHRHKLANSSLCEARGGLCLKPQMRSAGELPGLFLDLVASGGTWRVLANLAGPGGIWWSGAWLRLASLRPWSFQCDSPGLSIHLSARVQLLEAFNARS